MNGIPWRPKWRWQLTHAGVPDPRQECVFLLLSPNPISCTTQHVGLDDATSCTLPGVSSKVNGISGHINWTPATYDGELSWDGWSGPWTDDDYNFRLRYLNNDVSGLTPPNLEPSGGGHSDLEFDSDETVDHWGEDINDQTYFWPRFHAAVKQSDSAARSLIDGHYAIVTGLLGLDMSHSGSSELHPVYAMAIRIDSGRNFEDWAMFVRNYGDEGWCSSSLWTLPLAANRYTFALPWQGTTLPTPLAHPVPTAHFLTTDTTGQAEGPDLTYVPGQKVLVSFTLPKINPVLIPFQTPPAIWGVLRLNWVEQGVSLPPRINVKFLPETNTPEALLGDAVKKLPPRTQEKILRGLPLGKPGKHRAVTPARKPVTVATLKAVHVPNRPPVAVAHRDPTKVRLDGLRTRLICRAYSGKVPGLDICHLPR
jgi:hypothetical protein